MGRFFLIHLLSAFSPTSHSRWKKGSKKRKIRSGILSLSYTITRRLAEAKSLLAPFVRQRGKYPSFRPFPLNLGSFPLGAWLQQCQALPSAQCHTRTDSGHSSTTRASARCFVSLSKDKRSQSAGSKKASPSCWVGQKLLAGRDHHVASKVPLVLI